MKILWLAGAASCALSSMACSSTAWAQDMNAKAPSPATVRAQASVLASLPTDSGEDARFAKMGFIATRADPEIKAADGRTIWRLDAYDWMNGAAPASVNPSLWRHQLLLRTHGLFKVAEGVWQVRGFDVSNMTLIAGATGWIIIDPLTTQETAAAALQLANEKLGARPVVAVIYTHSHGDHFGGVRGVVDPAHAAKIFAPEGFVQEAVSENVIAGNAMGRRAGFQFGRGLTPGPQGLLGSGVGAAIPAGSITLIAPTETIRTTGEKRTIDGVEFEFQMVPESEAPAELNLYLPTQRTLLVAETATCTLHNIQTPRGALVRNALKWAGYLTEAIELYGKRTDTLATSHCWPRFGQARIVDTLALQRDNYKYLHDQAVRLMNDGETADEIAEELTPPPALAAQWSNHGYYGTYSHNAKAVYHRYLGHYDGNPATLNPLTPAEAGKRYVALAGGADRVIAAARTAMDGGDYRWAAELLNHLVFADPANLTAKALLADSYEQMGYQAESAIWRNMYLVGAKELRTGVAPITTTISGDVIAVTPTQNFFDLLATRLVPSKIGARAMTLALNASDSSEVSRISVKNGVLIGEAGKAAEKPDVTITGPRRLFLALFILKLPLEQLETAGLKVEGDREAIKALQVAIETPPTDFNIVTP